MKKKIMLGILLLCVFLIGFKLGERAVIYNQSIYDAQENQGTYFSEYKGQINEYYYEK